MILLVLEEDYEESREISVLTENKLIVYSSYGRHRPKRTEYSIRGIEASTYKGYAIITITLMAEERLNHGRELIFSLDVPTERVGDYTVLVAECWRAWVHKDLMNEIIASEVFG